MNSFLQGYFGLVKKLIPAKTQTTSVGLDIASGECKLVELKRKEDNTLELTNWAVEPINSANLKSSVQKIFSDLEISKSPVYTALFGKGTLIRYIDLPRMSPEDLRKSFAIEADKYFPFSQDQIYTDCYVLDPQGKDKKMSVVAAAAKKELIDQRVKLLNELGVNFNFIGVNPLALANAFSVLGIDEEIEKETAVGLLDLGESVSSLIVFMNKMPRFTRDIFVGGKELTKRISNALGISFEEAEKLKRNPGPRSKEVIAACHDAIMTIVQEIRLSFDYFSTEKNKDVKTLFLTGGASFLDGLPEAIEKNLDVKVRKWDPVSSLKISSEISSEDINKKSLKLGVAIGLALYDYD